MQDRRLLRCLKLQRRVERRQSLHHLLRHCVHTSCEVSLHGIEPRFNHCVLLRNLRGSAAQKGEPPSTSKMPVTISRMITGGRRRMPSSQL